MYKIPKFIAAAIDDVDTAKTRVMNLVQDEMAKIAKRKKIDEMKFLLTTSLIKNGDEVECAEIDALERAFCDIHSTGFMAIWTAADGWAN